MLLIVRLLAKDPTNDPEQISRLQRAAAGAQASVQALDDTLAAVKGILGDTSLSPEEKIKKLGSR
jgi:hypothetical protein